MVFSFVHIKKGKRTRQSLRFANIDYMSDGGINSSENLSSIILFPINYSTDLFRLDRPTIITIYSTQVKQARLTSAISELTTKCGNAIELWDFIIVIPSNRLVMVNVPNVNI